jgi:hypothetical protein
MEISELLKQAQTDLAFALAQGDATAEDAAAERIAQLEAQIAEDAA